MASLQHDIEAIASLEHSGETIRFGSIEGPSDSWSYVKSTQWPTSEQMLFILKDMFEGCNPASRISIAAVHHGQKTHRSAWISAARDFCEEDIAGVFLLEPDLCEVSLADMTEAERERFVFSRIPDALWEAALPVLFDETGLLSEFSPNSGQLELAPALSFRDLSNDTSILSRGCWGKGTFPVCEISRSETSTAYLVRVVTSRTSRILPEIKKKMNSILGSTPRGWLEGFNQIYNAFESAIPNSMYHPGFVAYNKLPLDIDCPERSYAVSLDRSKIPDLDEITRTINRMNDVATLFQAAFKASNIRFEPSNPRNEKETVAEFARLVKLLGISSQLEALDAGVPLEDVVV